jgi:hypothetical protein
MDCGTIISYEALLAKVLLPFPGTDCGAVRVAGTTVDPNAEPIDCAGVTLLEALWRTYDEAKNAIRVVEVGGFDPLVTCDTTGLGLETLGLDLIAINTDGDWAVKVAFLNADGAAPACGTCNDDPRPLESLLKAYILDDLAGRATMGITLVETAGGEELDCTTPHSLETLLRRVIGSGGFNINIV